MKNYILVSFLSLALVGATNSFAEDRNAEKEKTCNPADFHCYRAWKKQLKKEKKEYKAKYMCEYRPWAAERKMRKAHKKAWKRDMLEYSHGYDHGFWYWY